MKTVKEYDKKTDFKSLPEHKKKKGPPSRFRKMLDEKIKK